MFKVFGSKFAGIQLPGRMITPLGLTWAADEFVCHVVPEELQVSPELEKLSRELLAIKESAVDNQVFHYQRATYAENILELWIGLSWYRYTRLKAALDVKIRKEHPEFAQILLSKVQGENLFNLENLGGPLSSGVGPTALVILEKGNSIVMVHRSKSVGVNAGLWHPGLAEGINPEESAGGEIDMAAVAMRSAPEELGIEISRDQIQFLGFCVDGRYWWPGIISFASVPYSEEEVLERSRKARDAFEHDDLRFISCSTEGISKELRTASDLENGITGGGAMALLATGVVLFGREAMEQACAAV